ncbi:putative glutamine ABC transporter permease protein GlnM [Nonomuraea coxensis DSM 45129]|uniref:Glutamine ABC transporter permease protein GlnM n=1 Tax=Nonomuraea coxensis DSM 45129 TaxID=1122611 RepID=A0ABX8TWN2_9ACTN|nr:amino acid ABC transporter permease [Nonomuraea coxensis]QYC39695.1 putative glutamine ABC transporter permease protein GlnM [Nonomuraea coxensis DSM 45129]
MDTSALFDFSPLVQELDKILLGFWATIRLTLTSAVIALVLGTILVAMRVAPTPVLRWAGAAYVNVVRNTPLTLVLILCALGLSDTMQLTFSGDPTTNYFWWAVAGLAAYTATFVCEALRSGINTVSMGQAEAARAIGLTFTQTLRLVVLPQAFRTVISPLGSILIALAKNTTIVIVASYLDAAAQMKQMFDDYGGTIPIFLGFAFGYMVLTLPTGFLFGWLAKRMAVAR